MMYQYFPIVNSISHVVRSINPESGVLNVLNALVPSVQVRILSHKATLQCAVLPCEAVLQGGLSLAALHRGPSRRSKQKVLFLRKEFLFLPYN